MKSLKIHVVCPFCGKDYGYLEVGYNIPEDMEVFDVKLGCFRAQHPNDDGALFPSTPENNKIIQELFEKQVCECGRFFIFFYFQLAFLPYETLKELVRESE